VPTAYRLRPIRSDDQAEVDTAVALNNGAVPAVNQLSAGRLRELAGLATYAEVVEDDAGTLAGLVLVLPAGAAYDSALYAWFGQRYAGFLYLDRIVVDPAHRRRGVGRLVYDTMEQRALTAGRLLCEVNLDPPNPESLAFHAARGFTEVGRCTLPYQRPDGSVSEKVCQMLARELG